MTVKPELRGYKDKDNRKAVYIRIMNNGKRSYRKTNIKVTAGEWHKGKVKSSHPNAVLYNSLIKKAILEIEADMLEPSAKFPSIDFYKYCIDCLNEWDKTKASETHRQYTSEINKLKEFAPSVNLSAVTPEWLNRYKAFCFAKKNSVNTVHKNLKFVRVIIRKAHKEGLIERNPFDVFEMPKYRDPEKNYLSPAQVEAIFKIGESSEFSQEIRFVATWFCIGCCTGLRFSDMAQFNRRKHIVNNRIVLYTRKTSTPVSMPITPMLSLLFGRIDYRGVRITNTHFNRILKQIGGICEIDNLSCHVSRHTFAMTCANCGISQEVTAKLLGHSSLKTTSIYYKLSNLRIDDELKKLK